MEVRLAEHRGMCFGVRDAVDLALRLTRQGPLTILGDLVHNPDVVAQMDSAGAVRAQEIEQVQTRALLLTAHGTAQRVKLQLRAQGFQVHDATCPLVKRAHKALVKLVADGYFPVVIGQAGHVEVRGLVGDLDDYRIVLSEGDFAELDGPARRGCRFGVVAQTTQPMAVVEELVAALNRRFPQNEIEFVDTVCQPTKDRQESLERLVEETEVVVIVGGPNSNNTRKLTELARSRGRRAYQVASAGELRAEWFDGVRIVGVTAGTSTPDPVIDEVRVWLEALESR
jgi:4-hydroxy-3-methylbut-2-enyl diphosphate reductase